MFKWPDLSEFEVEAVFFSDWTHGLWVPPFSKSYGKVAAKHVLGGERFVPIAYDPSLRCGIFKPSVKGKFSRSLLDRVFGKEFKTIDTDISNVRVIDDPISLIKSEVKKYLEPILSQLNDKINDRRSLLKSKGLTVLSSERIQNHFIASVWLLEAERILRLNLLQNVIDNEIMQYKDFISEFSIQPLFLEKQTLNDLRTIFEISDRLEQSPLTFLIERKKSLSISKKVVKKLDFDYLVENSATFLKKKFRIGQDAVIATRDDLITLGDLMELFHKKTGCILPADLSKTEYRSVFKGLLTAEKIGLSVAGIGFHKVSTFVANETRKRRSQKIEYLEKRSENTVIGSRDERISLKDLISLFKSYTGIELPANLEKNLYLKVFLGLRAAESFNIDIKGLQYDAVIERAREAVLSDYYYDHTLTDLEHPEYFDIEEIKSIFNEAKSNGVSIKGLQPDEIKAAIFEISNNIQPSCEFKP